MTIRGVLLHLLDCFLRFKRGCLADLCNHWVKFYLIAKVIWLHHLQMALIMVFFPSIQIVILVLT